MAQNDHDIPVLIGHEGTLDGQRWMLREVLVLGREESCDIPIPNRQVSRRHAQINPTDDGVILKDMGSKNGTHCNGERIAEAISLNDGDVIHIALAQKFIYLSSDATLPIEFEETTLAAPQKRGRLLIEKRSRRVWIDDKEIIPPLSASQYSLLETLYDNMGRVVPRDELMAGVWGKQELVEISNQALDALVRRLRSRLAEFDPDHPYIATVRGHGLRLDNPPVE
jgi:pSer/pThr/pTyr-binding forkhead associated (FHA) protein